MEISTLQTLFKTHKETQLFGRYIHSETIEPLLEKHQRNFQIDVIGKSVLDKDIYAIKLGKGKIKVLMWSQMHGNECTATKAIFDLCNLFATSDSHFIAKILEKCTLVIIPMLNPDGAKTYSRFNANGIDLNRDAQDLSQPESRALRAMFDDFNPNFCFNLHDQRTIFSAGNNNHPATISFLAPAQDEACSITPTRQKAMEIIVRLNESLQKQIPNQIGIYDDTFNLKCVGDTFQSLHVPTILFEAGHYDKDYDREVVREYFFQSILLALHLISEGNIQCEKYSAYESIPQNQKLFYDIIIRNAKLREDSESTLDIAIQYQELLKDEKIQFVPMIERISNLEGFFGHQEIDADQQLVTDDHLNPLKEQTAIDFVYINDEKFSLKLENS